MARAEFERTASGDMNSDTLAFGLRGKSQVRRGKGRTSPFSMDKQPWSDQEMLTGPPRPPFQN